MEHPDILKVLFGDEKNDTSSPWRKMAQVSEKGRRSEEGDNMRRQRNRAGNDYGIDSCHKV